MRIPFAVFVFRSVSWTSRVEVVIAKYLNLLIKGRGDMAAASLMTFIATGDGFITRRLPSTNNKEFKDLKKLYSRVSFVF